MKVGGPACDTPALPRVNSSLPSGLNLNTWLPLTPASGPSLKGPLSTAQKFPSRSRQNARNKKTPHLVSLADVAGRINVQDRRHRAVLQPDAAHPVRHDPDRCARFDVAEVRPVLEHAVRVVHRVHGGELDGGRQVAAAASLPAGKCDHAGSDDQSGYAEDFPHAT